MTPRVTALAIQEAAQNGDMDTLSALLSRHEELLAGLSVEEAREACAILDQAEKTLREQMRDVRKELGTLKQKGRGLKQYKSAA